MIEYQPTFDPFREADLWDAAEESEPEPIPLAPAAITGAWEQSSLELELAPVVARPSRPRRNHVTEMANFAVRMGYASSSGDVIDQAVALRQYRLHNAMLAVLQRPHAQFLLSDRVWRDRWGRGISPGQHPVVLLVPGGPLMFLFDVSQTEPLPGSRRLPDSLVNDFAMHDVVDAGVALARLTSTARELGVRVSRAPFGNGLAGCIQRRATGITQDSGKGPVAVRFEVLLKDSGTDAERLTTLAHELSHVLCGHLGADRGDAWTTHTADHAIEEYEAEIAALAVLKRLAPEAVVPPYLDQFYAPGESPGQASWDRAMRAAAQIVRMAQD